jgi:hypothetical protein
VNDPLQGVRHFPYFERASNEVDEIMPPSLLPIERADVRALMILAWLRGAAWQSHGTN